MIEPVALVALAAAHLVQASLVALAATLVLRDTRRGSLPVRWRVAAWSFYGAALLPVAARLNGSLRISFGPDGAHILSVHAFELPSAGGWLEPAAAAIVAILAAGVLVRLTATARAILAGERLAARAVRIVDASSGRELAVSPEVAGPLVAGLRRSTVIVPPALLTLPAEELRPILEHELAHVRRGDIRGALMQRLVEDLFWWNPALGLLGRRLSEERELACDEAAASRTGRLAFGLALLGQARRALPTPSPALGVGALGASGLGRRIDRLSEAARPMSGVALVALLALIAGVAICTPRAGDTGATHMHVASG